ncbi:MAG: beta-aspartyl-peptidase [Tissierellia bacterium]|nr:beta-aspartyl-peptidase [Tissierellia bacterium]
MIIIKSSSVYSPKNLGIKDILIAGGEILKIDDNISNIDEFEIYDAKDKIVIPGFIDQHVHITGGGGEGGFTTRVPESNLSDYIKGGITTAIGLMGTDSVTRSMENLVAKAKSLNEEGITVYALTGAYEYPSPTITDSIKKDLVFIDEIIGAKISANDHRDSAITAEELARLGAEVRVAGMISGKSGHVVVHMGNGQFDMKQINDAIDISNLPITILRPTHINRKRSLCLEALEYAKRGGFIDISADIPSEISNGEIIEMAIENGVDLKQITMSSDGFGSWSKYDEHGNLLKIGYTEIDKMYLELINLISSGFALEQVLPLFTSNVADQLKLSRKGCIEENRDADLLILDSNLNLESVIAKGKWLMKNGEILKYGAYEK